MTKPSILVLGGTRFIGRVLVEQLLAAGQSDITLFHRGKTNLELFPQLPRILGDREAEDEVENGLREISSRDWDVVFDLSCWYPNNLEKLAASLSGKVGKYVFVSTVSVYDFEKEKGPYREKSSVLSCSHKQAVDTQPKSYGARKAECERRLFGTPDLDVVALRPSLVFGPFDYTDRLYYWLYRVMHNDHILLPEKGVHSSNYTFVEDLASFAIEISSKDHAQKVYNLSTYDPVQMAELLNRTAGMFNKHPIWGNADAKWLESQDVHMGADMPLIYGLDLKIDNHRAVEDYSGTFASLEQAMARTINWYADLGWPLPKAGISIEREKELLEMLSHRSL